MDGNISNNGLKIKRNENAIWRLIDDEIVVLLPEGAQLHALKGCGSRIWELIEGDTSVSKIVQNICDEYEVEPPRAREEIIDFFHKLEALKLIEITHATDKETKL